MQTIQSIISDLIPASTPRSVMGVELNVDFSLRSILESFNAAEEIVNAIEALSFQIVLKEGVLFTTEQIVCRNEGLEDDNPRGPFVVGSTTDYRQIALSPETGELAVIPERMAATKCLTRSSSSTNSLFIDKEKTACSRSMGGYAIPLQFRFCTDFQAMVEACPGVKQQYSPANNCFLTWLKKRKVPFTLFNFFSWFMPTDEIVLGAGMVNGFQDIMAINDAWPEAMDNGFFIIGYCPNGDPIALKTQSQGFETGYLSHEEIDHSDSMETHYIPIAKSFSAFFHDANMFGYCPTDYWQAKGLSYRRLG